MRKTKRQRAARWLAEAIREGPARLRVERAGCGAPCTMPLRMLRPVRGEGVLWEPLRREMCRGAQ